MNHLMTAAKSPAECGANDAYYSHKSAFSPNYRNADGIRVDIKNPLSNEWKEYAEAFYKETGAKDYGEPEIYSFREKDEP